MKTISILMMSLCCLLSGVAQASVKVQELRVENLRSPLSIDTTTPHLSWQVVGANPRSYQIQVASDSLSLVSGKADLWDSRKVKSTESIMIRYAGKQLSSRSQCYWRVRVWGDKGSSEWSSISRFGIGLLDAASISGEFIGYPAAGRTSAMLRRSFEVENLEELKLLHVNSLGYHEVYINGRRVGDQILQPAVSQMDKRSLWVTYDVTSMLRKGSNDLLIWLGSGWYKPESFGRWDSDKASYDQPLVRAQIDALNGSKWTTLCTTDRSWEGALTGYADTGSWNAWQFWGERVDARLNPADLNDLSASQLTHMNWNKVVAVAKLGHKSTPQMCEPNRIRAAHHPVDIRQVSHGYFLIDMGKVVTGWFELKLAGLAPGTELTIEYGDELDKNGNIDWQAQRDTYIARGGRERFINKFNYHAFRYVSIKGSLSGYAKEDVTSYLMHTDFDKASEFECSDKDLNAIHEMINYTMTCLTYSGYMVDCPHIERAGYGGDGNSSTEALQTMYNVSPLYVNWMQAWSDAMREGGSLPHVAPSGGGGGGPYWCGFIVMAPWQTYLNYGDKRLIEKHYDDMKAWMGYVEKNTRDGMLQRWPDTEYRDWYLGDWLAPHGVDAGNGNSVDLVNNCFISDCMDKMSRMASLLGKHEDAEKFAKAHKDLNTLLHKRYYDPETHSYATGSQLDLSYPMLVGVTPESERANVTARLKENTSTRHKDHIAGGLFGVPIFTKWAIKDHAADLVYTMLKKRDYPGYLYMIDNGATATWEYWSGERSRVHNCYNGIGTWFYQALGGLRTDDRSTGYKHVIIDPQIPEGVTWSKVSKQTPYGEIRLYWELTGGEIVIRTTIPSGVTASVVVPSNATSCLVGGKQVSIAKGKFTLARGDHQLRFSLR